MPPRLLCNPGFAALAPQLALDLRLLPSGVAFLNVYPGGREFVLEYDPARGTGVSENTAETTPFDHGHERVFDTVEAAAEHLIADCSQKPFAMLAPTPPDFRPD